MKYTHGYYVKHGDKGVVESICVIDGDKRELLELNIIGSFTLSAKKKNILKDYIKVNNETYHIERRRFLSNENKKSLQKTNFSKDDFSDSLQYLLGAPPLGKFKTVTETPKLKCKYILFQDNEEVVTGFSNENIEQTTNKLVSAITGNKSILVHDERGEPCAFYNKVVTGDLSFSIYDLK